MRRGWFDRGGTGGAQDSLRPVSFPPRLPALPPAPPLAAGVICCGSEKGPPEPAISALPSVPGAPGPVARTAVGATRPFPGVAKAAKNNPGAGAVFLGLPANHTAATVDGGGPAPATGPGSVTITAAARGLPGAATLSVTQAPV